MLSLADNPDFLFENVAMRWIRCSALLLAVLVAACGGKGSPADPPSDLRAESLDNGDGNGDGQVTLNWTAKPGHQYWVLCAPGNTVSAKSWFDTAGGNAYRSASDGAGIYNGDTALAQQAVTPPFNVTGLRNDVSYSFTVNARTDGGPGGTGATPVTMTPRLGGTHWSTPTALSLTALPSSAHIRAMTFGAVTSPLNSTKSAFMFVAVGESGAVYSSADNQQTWTARSLPTPVAGRQLNDIVHTQGRFVAVGNSGTIVYSADGVSWTVATINSATSLSSTHLTAVALGGSTLMAVGQGGVVLTSNDGITWTAQSTGISENLHAVAYSAATSVTLPSAVTTPAFWLAAGADGAVYTSVDSGQTWLSANTGLNSATWRGVSVLTQTTSTLDCGLNNSLLASEPKSTSYAIALVGDSGQVATAVAVSGSPSNAAPALTWTPSTLLNSPSFTRVISPSGQFVAVGAAGAIYTGQLSANASSVTWTRRPVTAFSTDLNGLLRYGKDAALPYSNSYMAYGQSGVTLFSR